MRATNATPHPMSDFTFLAAVPKTFQLALEAQSGNVLPPGNSGTITQRFKVNNPQQQPLRMRVKITFTHNGAPVALQNDVNSFPLQ
jgi:hypothetical protein